MSLMQEAYQMPWMWREEEGKGKWTLAEQRIYILFLKQNLERMKSRVARKTHKVFLQMSKQVSTRTADQCRSHHQKISKYHRSLEEIISYYEEALFPAPKQQQWRTTADVVQMPFYSLRRNENIFRLQISIQQIEEY